jgi:hypothetical protein
MLCGQYQWRVTVFIGAVKCRSSFDKAFLAQICQLQLKHVDDKHKCAGPVNSRLFTSYCLDDINIIGFNIQMKICATFGVTNINIKLPISMKKQKTFNLPFRRATISVVKPYLLALFKRALL